MKLSSVMYYYAYSSDLLFTLLTWTWMLIFKDLSKVWNLSIDGQESVDLCSFSDPVDLTLIESWHFSTLLLLRVRKLKKEPMYGRHWEGFSFFQKSSHFVSKTMNISK